MDLRPSGGKTKRKGEKSMRLFKSLFAATLTATFMLFSATASYTQDQDKKKEQKKAEEKKTDLSKAKETVDKIRQADPPQASTSTVTSSSDTAKNIADRENRKEHEREKEKAKKNKTKDVPPPPK
jgi:hypothetical protein